MGDPPSLQPPDRPIPREGEVRLRVRYNECDPMGLAHHASYVAWLELGRTDLLRACGVTYRDMEAAKVYLVVTRLEVRYKAPARYDDELAVLTRVSGGGRARIDHAYEVWHDAGDGRGRSTLCATANSTLACIGPGARPRALPEWLRADRHT